MFITPSFKKSLIVEQFQGNYLKPIPLITLLYVSFVIGLLKDDVIVQGFIDVMCWLAMSKSNKEL